MGPLTVICILGLVVGTASALFITATDAGAAPASGQVGNPHHPDLINVTREQGILIQIEDTGADVTGSNAHPLSGDVVAMEIWPGCSVAGELPPDLSCGLIPVSGWPQNVTGNNG
ncbi:MAG TPA: hypothetical protein VKO45_08960 [Methanomicrobiales archaeon]|nr:hypothetical protein [Methanomicrobiales archaeon]